MASETVTVKAARQDGRVAFFERDKSHPGGQVFVRGEKAVEAAKTRAIEQAIADGRLVLVQTTPVTEQTPPTKTAGTEAGDAPASSSKKAPASDAKAGK